MRSIVFSDVHGEPEIISAVVAHSGYVPGHDRLIFAGDAVDIGRDPLGCLALLGELEAECLVGNHDWGAHVDWAYEERDPRVAEHLGRLLTSGEWRLAAVADGVLITHAGVSSEWDSCFAGVGQGDVTTFAEALNDEFVGAIRLGYGAAGDIIDDEGPLWWRPSRSERPLAGVLQVAGHTPRELLGQLASSVTDLEAQGLYLVDPNVRAWARGGYVPPAPVRYAVIENGAVEVVCV